MPHAVSKSTLELMARCDFLKIENKRISSAQRLAKIKEATGGRLWEVWLAVNGKRQEWDQFYKQYKRNNVELRK